MATRPSGANDLTGQRFGQLVVTGQATPSIFGDRSPRWRCKCDCGRRTAISEVSLFGQENPTCGYSHTKRTPKKKMTPRLQEVPPTRHKLYSAWVTMKRRCYDPNSAAYSNYGARGITVCKRWLDSFEAFAADMGEKPSPTHTIERLDNSGNYEPSNCAWRTMAEQSRNKRSNRMVDFAGQQKCVADWSKETGINESTLHRRIHRRRMSPDEALTTPVEARTPRVITYNGKTQSVQAWAKECRIPHKLLAKRIYERGWSVERALTEPVEEATVYEFNGEQLTIVEWSKKLGIPKRTLYSRLHDHGWSIEKTLTEPTEKGPSFEFEGKRLSLKDISRETGIPYRTLGYRVLTKGMAIEDAIADCRR